MIFKKNPPKDKYLKMLFLFIFIFYSIFIFQGMDVTDTGYILTNQVYSFTDHPDITYSAMWFLSDFFGGMWLKIIGTPNILWARLGGVILNSLNAIIIFNILSMYFNKEKVFFAVLVSTLFINMIPGPAFSTLISYYTFPAFLVNIVLLIFNQSINTPENETDFKIYNFLLGFIFIPIVLSRFTLILIGLLPILIFLYYALTNKDVSRFKKSLRYVIYGVLISMILFILLYWYIGFLGTYISIILSQTGISAGAEVNKIDKYYTLNNLLTSYLYDGMKIAGWTIVALIVLYFTSLIKNRIGKNIFNFLIVFLTILVMILINPGIITLLRATIGLIIIIQVFFLYTDKGKNEKLTLLIITSGFFMLINPIGSSEGFKKSIYCMWLILPLSILIVDNIKDKMKSVKVKSILSLLNIIIVIIFIISLFSQFHNVYRDDPNRFNLNKEFSYKYLNNVYSTEERVRVLDELLFQVDAHTEKNDEVLIENDIPMIYYLTETKPAYGNPCLFYESLEEIRKKHYQMINEHRYPKLFVFAKINTEDPDWPKSTWIESNWLNKTEKIEYLKNEYINKLNYTLLWENEAFAIYAINETYNISR